jgi:hypothetical protein
MGDVGRPRGGVSILVAPTMPAPTLIDSGENYLVVRIDSVLLVAAYFSPAMDDLVFIEQLADIFSSLPADQHIILAGDFNCGSTGPCILRELCFSSTSSTQWVSGSAPSRPPSPSKQIRAPPPLTFSLLRSHWMIAWSRDPSLAAPYISSRATSQWASASGGPKRIQRTGVPRG